MSAAGEPVDKVVGRPRTRELHLIFLIEAQEVENLFR